jgi:UDP-N-acetylmuramyl pentapeptide phosphotransferase/UDP-N-acetylglucosamine-1-phosphate transferase
VIGPAPGRSRLLACAGGALASRAALALLAPPGRPGPSSLRRRNHRGAEVTLAPGPALVAGLLAAAALGAGSDRPLAAAASLAATAAGAAGWYDDTAGARAEQRTAKGFAGHLGALREARVTSGAVKLGGIGAAGLGVGLLLTSDPAGGPCSRAAGAVGTGVLVAGSANLVNLLDLRPGRALKASLVPALLLAAAAPRGGGPALAAGAVGAAGALLPEDLRERGMLGDTGANALGAVLGTAAAARLPGPGRLAAALGVAALSALSERVSFSRVIDATPPLTALDRLGRLPAEDG